MADQDTSLRTNKEPILTSSAGTGLSIVKVAFWFLMSVTYGALMQIGTNSIRISLDLLQFPQSYRSFLYYSVYSSWWLVYGALGFLTWLLLAFLNRKSLSSPYEAPCIMGVPRALWIVYVSLACFCLMRFIECFRWYGLALLLQMFLGLLPSSSPKIIYSVLSLPHVLILGMLSLWMMLLCQNCRTSTFRISAIFFIGAISLSMTVRFLEYVMNETPVLLPQLSALLLVGISFYTWKKRNALGVGL